jgi:hypothetical protein
MLPGRQNMFMGAGTAAIGIVPTVGSYQLASTLGAGRPDGHLFPTQRFSFLLSNVH